VAVSTAANFRRRAETFDNPNIGKVFMCNTNDAAIDIKPYTVKCYGKEGTEVETQIPLVPCLCYGHS
jgi:hypothetical protein